MSDKKKKRKPAAAGAGASSAPAAKPAAAEKAPPAAVAKAAVEDTESASAPTSSESHGSHGAAPRVAHASHDESDTTGVIAASDLFGLMGWFPTPAELYHACEALRDAGYKEFDAHTPFPVHGLEKAMGLPPTKFPFMVFGGGVAGLTGAITLAWYTQEVWYPQNISGKQPFSWQAYIPIFFELTVLAAGLTCFFGLWAWLKLPMHSHPTFQHPSFHRHSDDAFFISVEAKDPKFDREKTKAMLEKLGVLELQEVRS